MSLLEPSLRLKFVAIRMFTRYMTSVHVIATCHRYMSSCCMKIAQFELNDNLEANSFRGLYWSRSEPLWGFSKRIRWVHLLLWRWQMPDPRTTTAGSRGVPVSIRLTVNWDSGPLIARLLSRRIVLRQFGKWGCRVETISTVTGYASS